MTSIAAQKASALQAPVREWLEGLFGRKIGPDEDITVMAFHQHAPATGTERDAANARIDQFLATAAKNMEQATPAEIDSTIDEATRNVKNRSH